MRKLVSVRRHRQWLAVATLAVALLGALNEPQASLPNAELLAIANAIERKISRWFTLLIFGRSAA